MLALSVESICAFSCQKGAEVAINWRMTINVSLGIGLTAAVLMFVMIAVRRLYGSGKHKMQVLWVRLTPYVSNNRYIVHVRARRTHNWRKLAGVDDRFVHLSDGGKIARGAIGEFVASYQNGQAVDGWNVTYPLPEGIRELERKVVQCDDEFEKEAWLVGASIVSVTFGVSPIKKPNYYSTTLTNLSEEKIKVVKFAGLAQVGGKWKVSTVTGDYYSAEEFREWYGMKDEWILPGGKACDENNYGGYPGVWAYWCVSESGRQFLTGGQPTKP